MTKSVKGIIAFGVVGIAFAAVVIVLLRTFPGLRSFELGAQNGGLTLSVNAEGRFEIRDFLDNLLADTTQSAHWAREDLSAWSREHLGLLAISDAEVVEALGELCPLVEVRDIEAYQSHVESCEQHTVVRELRRRSLEREPPFQPPGRTVRLGTPPDPPQSGTAFTCYEGEFENRRVRISVSGRPDAIEVIARGAYVCPETGRYPDLQISPEDAETLYGRATREYETAIALVT